MGVYHSPANSEATEGVVLEEGKDGYREYALDVGTG